MAVRRPNTAAQESEAFRLERAVNLFTAQFEHERKHGLLLSEQIRQCEEQLRHHMSSPRLLASTPEERRLRLQFSGLERQIALLNTQIAEIQTGNRELKEMIDGERLNRRTKKGAVETMREDLKTVTVRKGDRSLERIKWKEEDQTQRFEMTQLRCKSAQHTLRQRAKIQELEVTPTQVHVKEDVMLRDQLFRTIKETFRLQSVRAMETLDPSPVQSALLQKWSPVPFPLETLSGQAQARRLPAPHCLCVQRAGGNTQNRRVWGCGGGGDCCEEDGGAESGAGESYGAAGEGDR